MKKEINKITCPQCKYDFDVEEMLSNKLEKEIKDKLEQKYKNKEDELLKKENDLNKSIQQEIEKEKEKIKIIAKEEFKTEIDSLSVELKEKREEFNKLKNKEIEHEKLKRKFDDQKKEYELRHEKALYNQQKEIEEVIAKREQNRSQMKLLEKDKQLLDLKKQIEEMKRKVEQGSSQLQGEVQEIAIENILNELFPFDEIAEVPKGKKGADAIQLIKTFSGSKCGKIIYESKRTKKFNYRWIEKLKEDQLKENADIAVLVTEELPEDIDKIGMRDGIWICSFCDFKGLTLVLRDSILKMHAVLSSKKNKGNKMNLLYDYLTSNEFKMQIESIIEGFTNLKQSIQNERNAMEKLWKEREKQLERVLLNTTHFYGSIKGIAGDSIPIIPLLELANEEK